MTLRSVLNRIPSRPFIDDVIVYLTSVFYHRSLIFYFQRSLNSYMLRSKTRSTDLRSYVDKIEAKGYIEERIGKDWVIPTLSVYDFDRNDSIPCGDWVFKSNNDFRGAIICRDGELIDVKGVTFSETKKVGKDKSNIQASLEKFCNAKVEDPTRITRETVYSEIRPQYFFEELVISEHAKYCQEYKFHVVKGRVRFVYVVIDRLGRNKRGFLNRDAQQIDVIWCKPRDRKKFTDNTINEVSGNFDLMVRAAETLAEPFKYVRIDFYDALTPKVGELTFFHGSGLEQIIPKNVDFEIGRELYE